VPGGVGPLTNALLLAHLVRAARSQAARRTAVGGLETTAPVGIGSDPRPTATRGVR
jgi:hypothetical protein